MICRWWDGIRRKLRFELEDESIMENEDRIKILEARLKNLSSKEKGNQGVRRKIQRELRNLKKD